MPPRRSRARVPSCGVVENVAVYAREFFDLQLEFAEKASALSGLPFPRAVLDYTNLYIRFGCGRDFDPTHPTWQEYAAGLSERQHGVDLPADVARRREWTYRFYTTRSPAVAPPGLVATFGCFSYARLGTDQIRLHFHDGDRDGRSPLGAERRVERLAELAALFAHVKRTTRHPVRVVGASWLYNVDAYRRLFPESYLGTARAIRGRFRHMPLWGQFVNRHGAVKEDIARRFRGRLARQSSLEGLDQCFPFQVLALESPVCDFYRFHGV